MTYFSKMHVRKVAIVFLYLITVFISTVLTSKESNKRMPGSSSHAFQPMLRYGRSSNKEGKINVYPRADVFYLGPRYGKRSQQTSSHLQSLSNSMHTCINDRSYSCTYAGVSNLYRCNNSRRSTVNQNRM